MNSRSPRISFQYFRLQIKKNDTNKCGKHLVTSWPNYDSRQGSGRVQPLHHHWSASAAARTSPVSVRMLCLGRSLTEAPPPCHTNPCLNLLNPTGLFPHPQTVTDFSDAPPFPLSPTANCPLTTSNRLLLFGNGSSSSSRSFHPAGGREERRSTS